MTITLLPAYQSVGDTWYVPWRADGQRNERKYVGKLPNDATIRSDVQKWLDAQAVQAVADVASAKAKVLADAKNALGKMEVTVFDKDGKPAVGVTVKVVTADTKESIGNVVTAAGVIP